MHHLLALAPRAHRCVQPKPWRASTLGGVVKLSWFRCEHSLCLRRLPFVLPTLVRVTSGQARVEVEGRGEILGAGAMRAWPAGSELSVETRPDSRAGFFSAIALSFDPAWLHDRVALPGAAGSDVMFHPSPALDACWTRLFDDWQAGAEAERVLVEVESLLSILREEHLAQALCSSRTDRAWTDRVRAELLSTPGRRWEAGDVAEQLSVSEATLRRHLMQENTCFRVLLEEVRLAKSLELLLDHPNAVAAVAARCGYESCSRFSARFQRRFGLKPSELRSGSARRA